MNVKRFNARTSREALALVRQAFGDDAVVVSNRPCADGVEVLAMAGESVGHLERVASSVPLERGLPGFDARPASRLDSRIEARADARLEPRLEAAPEPAADPLSAPVEQDVQQLSMSTLSFQDYVRDRMLRRRQAELARESAPTAEPRHEAAPPRRAKVATPYSYVATTNAILWEGCTPIFVDIDPETFCINPELIEEAITEHTTAILATHVYGYPCDVDRIQQIADRFNLKVIYDAAHAFGVRVNGESLLKYGDCCTLSFHATKLFHTAEGGAVVCRDKQLSDRIFLMSKFGHLGEEEYLDIGINWKMSELHAAMGLALLPHLTEIIANRRERSIWYDQLLEGLKLQRPKFTDGLEYNHAYYPIVFNTHQEMMAVRTLLQSNQIFPRRYFYPSLNTLPFLMEGLRRPCPVSESLAQRVLVLPLYPALTRQDVEKITLLVKNALLKIPFTISKN